MLPYLTADLPGIGGVLRAKDDDFFVDEVPAYQPSGSGDHVYIRIEKRGLTTPDAVNRIAKALAINPRDIGVAGMKDRHAVTRQWLSLPPPIKPDALPVVPEITILETSRHRNKLRTGHVRANRFVLRVRSVGIGAATIANAILSRLAAAPGAPNWYGEQRFGREGNNAERGLAILRGEPPPRDKKLARLFVSALQSQLFNAWLTARLADGLYAHVVPGDVLHRLARDVQADASAEQQRAAGGAMFTSTDAAADEQRLLASELVITGPMFGDRMRAPPDGSVAAAREATILDAAGLTRDAFACVRALAEGTRRDATIHLADASAEQLAPDVVEVRFTLPGGAYATAVMRELMKSELPAKAEA